MYFKGARLNFWKNQKGVKILIFPQLSFFTTISQQTLIVGYDVNFILFINIF
jgi:hypothetical protein